MLKRILLITLVLGVVFTTAYAQQIYPLPRTIKPKGLSSLEFFKKIAISDQGRIKPLDTYARNLMIRFSGKGSFNQEPAIEWLAKLLFAPGATREDKIFLINNAEIFSKLRISTKAKGRYSFSQIEPNLQKLTGLAKSTNEINKTNRNIVGNEIIRLYQNIVLYTNLAKSFSFAVPDSDFQVNSDDVVQLLDLSQGKNVYSFFDIASKAEVIMSATEDVEEKGGHMKTPQEEELLRLLGNLYRWSMSYENESIAIIPTLNSQEKSWVSPWEAINREFKNPEIEKEIGFLRNLIVHYWNGEQLQFDMAVRAFQGSIKSREYFSGAKNFSELNFEIEIFNNQLKPLLWAPLFYGFALLVFIVSVFFKQVFLQYVSLFLMFFGFILHTWAIITLSLIMARPPLADSHEIFSFIGLISVLGGFIFIGFKKKSMGRIVSIEKIRR